MSNSLPSRCAITEERISNPPTVSFTLTPPSRGLYAKEYLRKITHPVLWAGLKRYAAGEAVQAPVDARLLHIDTPGWYCCCCCCCWAIRSCCVIIPPPPLDGWCEGYVEVIWEIIPGVPVDAIFLSDWCRCRERCSRIQSEKTSATQKIDNTRLTTMTTMKVVLRLLARIWSLARPWRWVTEAELPPDPPLRVSSW